MLIQRCLSIEYLDFSDDLPYRDDALIVAIIRFSPELKEFRANDALA
jgi:hypothetical protein